MFIISTDQTNPKGSGEEKIIQFQLSTAFDTTTASFLGTFSITMGEGNVGTTGRVGGMAFDSSGSKLYIVSQYNSVSNGLGNDVMHQYSLECSYGIFGSVDDSVSNIGSQVQLAKQNVNLNTSVIFKRFEWIKRNRESENLNSFNFDINYHSKLL